MADETPLSLQDIHAIERGELNTSGKPKFSPPADAQAKLREAVASAKMGAQEATSDSPGHMLADLLSLGGSGEVPPLTIGGIALLEMIQSPFLQEPVDGKLIITTMDTARALWSFAGGANGCAPLLSALALERAADELPPEYSSPLRVKAGQLRGQWDAAALQALEASGKTKVELDAELLVRLRDIFSEIELAE